VYLGDFALYGPLFALGVADRRLAFKLVTMISIPSFVAGLTLCLSSGNGAHAAGIGMYPGAIASVILFALWTDDTARRMTLSSLRPLWQLAPLSYLYTVAWYTLADAQVYRDSPIPELTAKVTEGPYRGLYTTPSRRSWLSRVGADIRKHRSTSRSLFYYDFPVGYLYGDQPPLAVSTWIFSWTPNRAAMESRYFYEHASPGDYVFRFGGGFNPTGTSVDAAVKAHCEQVGSGDGYELWRVQPRAEANR
jgi:hypothetical protein